jgi:hypothetical protein
MPTPRQLRADAACAAVEPLPPARLCSSSTDGSALDASNHLVLLNRSLTTQQDASFGVVAGSVWKCDLQEKVLPNNTKCSAYITVFSSTYCL